MKIEKANKIGFCFGVRRALEMIEKAIKERGSVETLGAVVHNEQVLQRLTQHGMRITSTIEEISGDTIVLGAHGVSPQVKDELKKRRLNIIDTTCPFVCRAQSAARNLAKAGFFIILYGDVNHPEVKGVLGWANNNGIATLNVEDLLQHDLPRRIGVLSQTTQISNHFIEFVTQLLNKAYVKDSEIRLVDTICYDIRERQAATLEVAKKVDLMIVIGGKNSANTRHLAELASGVTPSIKIETAAEIKPTWFINRKHIGVTAGASTADETIDEVMQRLYDIASDSLAR